MILSQARGELWLYSPKGVQHSDVRHPHHDYADAGGDPSSSDLTDEATTDRYTNTPPCAADGSPGVTATHPT
jgi:hypothetical protein